MRPTCGRREEQKVLREERAAIAEGAAAAGKLYRDDGSLDYGAALRFLLRRVEELQAQVDTLQRGQGSLIEI